MHKELEKLLLSVGYNLSSRCDCPVCGGNKTLSISNLGSSIAYNCFRNSCSLRGNYRYVPVGEEIGRILKVKGSTDVFKEFKLPPYIKLGIASKKAFNWISVNNGLESFNRGMYRVGYDSVQDRIVYLLVHDNYVKGAIGRSLSRGFPKTLVYDNSKIMPFVVGNSDIAVIVEDCASAASINCLEQYTGFALLGTIFKSEYVPYLYKFKKLIIALDPDAKRKSIDLKNSLTYLHKDVSIWQIPIDFKNMTKDEIKNYLGIN